MGDPELSQVIRSQTNHIAGKETVLQLSANRLEQLLVIRTLRRGLLHEVEEDRSLGARPCACPARQGLDVGRIVLPQQHLRYLRVQQRFVELLSAAAQDRAPRHCRGKPQADEGLADLAALVPASQGGDPCRPRLASGWMVAARWSVPLMCFCRDISMLVT